MLEILVPALSLLGYCICFLCFCSICCLPIIVCGIRLCFSLDKELRRVIICSLPFLLSIPVLAIVGNLIFGVSWLCTNDGFAIPHILPLGTSRVCKSVFRSFPEYKILPLTASSQLNDDESVISGPLISDSRIFRKSFPDLKPIRPFFVADIPLSDGNVHLSYIGFANHSEDASPLPFDPDSLIGHRHVIRKGESVLNDTLFIFQENRTELVKEVKFPGVDASISIKWQIDPSIEESKHENTPLQHGMNAEVTFNIGDRSKSINVTFDDDIPSPLIGILEGKQRSVGGFLYERTTSKDYTVSFDIKKCSPKKTKDENISSLSQLPGATIDLSLYSSDAFFSRMLKGEENDLSRPISLDYRSFFSDFEVQFRITSKRLPVSVFSTCSLIMFRISNKCWQRVAIFNALCMKSQNGTANIDYAINQLCQEAKDRLISMCNLHESAGFPMLPEVLVTPVSNWSNIEQNVWDNRTESLLTNHLHQIVCPYVKIGYDDFPLNTASLVPKLRYKGKTYYSMTNNTVNPILKYNTGMDDDEQSKFNFYVTGERNIPASLTGNLRMVSGRFTIKEYLMQLSVSSEISEGEMILTDKDGELKCTFHIFGLCTSEDRGEIHSKLQASPNTVIDDECLLVAHSPFFIKKELDTYSYEQNVKKRVCNRHSCVNEVDILGESLNPVREYHSTQITNENYPFVEDALDIPKNTNPISIVFSNTKGNDIETCTGRTGFSLLPYEAKIICRLDLHEKIMNSFSENRCKSSNTTNDPGCKTEKGEYLLLDSLLVNVRLNNLPASVDMFIFSEELYANLYIKTGVVYDSSYETYSESIHEARGSAMFQRRDTDQWIASLQWPKVVPRKVVLVVKNLKNRIITGRSSIETSFSISQMAPTFLLWMFWPMATPLVILALLIIIYIFRGISQCIVNHKQSSEKNLIETCLYHITCLFGGGAGGQKLSFFGYLVLKYFAKEFSLEDFKPKMLPITYHNLSFGKILGGKAFLKNCSGIIAPGSMTAILGGSGSGKTTFLTTIAGRNITQGVVKGQLRIGEVDVRNLASPSCPLITGFVPQEDVMLREMTVFENLLHSAIIKLGRCSTRYYSLREVVGIVLWAIDLLKLNNVMHQIIGDESKRGISGGQRKRVNVGMELVGLPDCLLLDEPTSGLDGTSSFILCKALEEMGRRGCIVMAVVHNPRHEIFKMFDNLAIFCAGEQLINGPLDDVVRIIKTASPGGLYNLNSSDIPDEAQNDADLILDLVTYYTDCNEDERNDWKRTLDMERSKTVPQIQEFGYSLHSFKKIGFFSNLFLTFRHLCAYSCRSMVQLTRMRNALILDAVILLAVSAFIGKSFEGKGYIGSAPSAVIMKCPVELRSLCGIVQSDTIIATATYVSLMVVLCMTLSSLRLFGAIHERNNFQRESHSMYFIQLCIYFVTKDLSLLPITFISSILFLLPYYYFVQPHTSILFLFLILALLIWISQGMGYCLSILLPPQMAQLGLGAAVFTLNLFSGSGPTLAELKDMGYPIPIMPYISFMRYWKELVYVKELQHYKDSYDISKSLEVWSYSYGNINWLISVLIMYGIVLRIIAFVLLYLRTPNNTIKQIWSALVGYISPLKV